MPGYDYGTFTVAWCQCWGHQHDGDQQSYGLCLTCGCPTDRVKPPWEPPPPVVSFCVSSYKTLFRKRTRYTAWVNSVSIWAMQDQPHFRGWTEQEALEKAQENARKRFPEEMANTPDPPRISYLP